VATPPEIVRLPLDELPRRFSRLSTKLRLLLPNNTGSAVASAHPIVSPTRISWGKSSASGATVTGVFTRRSEPASHRRSDFLEPRGRVARKGRTPVAAAPPPRKGRNSRRVIRSPHPHRRDLSIMREENMPHGHFDTPNQWWFTVKPVGSPMSVTSQLSP
jgi:hypothetical protein